MHSPACPGRDGLGAGLIRLAAAAAGAVLLAFSARPVAAQDPGAAPNEHHEAARIVPSWLGMTRAASDMQAIVAPQPSGVIEKLRQGLASEGVAYAFRTGARAEELRIYELASYSGVEAAVIPLLPAAVQGPLQDSIAGLHSLYILAGIDQYYLVN